MRSLLTVLSTLAWMAAATTGALAQDRVALLIGNSVYENESRLDNPLNDVQAMKSALETLDFVVEVVENADERAMSWALRDFRRRAAGADTALLFYSGHGMEIDGRNFLVPVDAKLEHADDAGFEAISLNDAVAAASGAARLSVVIVDACRSNKFPGATRDGTRGFTPVKARRGQLIAFSTAPGEVAYDGEGAISPYTQALTETLTAPEVSDLDVRRLFGGLGPRVSALINQPQEPFTHSAGFGTEVVTLTGVRITIEPITDNGGGGSNGGGGGGGGGGTAALRCEAADARALFGYAADANDCIGYSAFLEACPDSLQAPLAKAGMQRLGCTVQASAGSAGASSETAAVAPSGGGRTGSPPPAPWSASTSDYITAQQELSRLNFYTGAIDGDWGAGSRVALERFQLESGIQPADGELTLANLHALKEAPTPAPNSPETTPDLASFKECDICPEMVVVPAGGFEMGTPDYEAGRADDEGPVHKVTVQRFALGETEVSLSDFRRFVKATGHDLGNRCRTRDDGSWQWREGKTWLNPGYSQSGSHPVVCVSWYDVQAYIDWLNGFVDGEPYRLPSEAEWEYAARAGTDTAYIWGKFQNSSSCTYANGADKAALRSDANWTTADCDDGYVETAPVGSFQPNNFGLKDMVGNVWEWTQDCWNTDYTGNPPTDGSAWMTGDCTQTIVRGGSWLNSPAYLRSGNRSGIPRDYRNYYYGFRVARTLAPR